MYRQEKYVKGSCRDEVQINLHVAVENAFTLAMECRRFGEQVCECMYIFLASRSSLHMSLLS